MAKFVSERDLQNRIGADRIDQLTDDDCDGDGENEVITEILDDADRKVISCLYDKGFTNEQLNKLSRDRTLRRLASNIAAMYAGQRRTEWLNDRGEGPFDRIGKDAVKELKDISTAVLRVGLEEQHGANPLVRGCVTTGDPNFQVAKNPNDPNDLGKGGF